MTTEEVLEYLQVNIRTIYRLIKAGKIPAVRVGRQWRFRKRDIDGWLDRQGRGAPPGPAPTPPPMPARVGRPRILVVDDEPSVRQLLARVLEMAEYDVDVAEDGASAIELLKQRPYDLLFTDLKMPGIDGLAVVREARHYRGDMPIVMITGFSSEAAAIEALNLGVGGYLKKPFRVPKILATAARLLGE